jgi:hypothetical protein
LESAVGRLPAHMLVDGDEWLDFEKGWVGESGRKWEKVVVGGMDRGGPRACLVWTSLTARIVSL